MEKKTGKEMAEQFINFVNSFSIDKKGFVEGITSSHRTLQQSVFSLMLDCIKTWSDMYESQTYDGRNEDTCKLCNQIYHQFKDIWFVRFI